MTSEQKKAVKEFLKNLKKNRLLSAKKQLRDLVGKKIQSRRDEISKEI